ncbi:hypothetical protein [Candidatus Marinarcus aquaticus]|uniref:Uncharacterized protein n=1 Tax=Candidatus Marinarcus aquaticus TaxID=2044504 RepID=A0A4Q0XTV3_9BACT|nr:hypothetical protein [Candidatus Marinarcus aquaticus]RXJ60812.1 hypothetical protein CRV04_02015 [Candidatus Marinarcus aquaticus]
MEKINTVGQLKLAFLDMWKEISDEETQALLTYDKLLNIEKRYKDVVTESFPIEKIVLVFHAYASIAYLSAELIVNAKIYLDNKKENYILLARKQTENSFQFSIVYSNIKELSSHPGLGIPIDNMIGYLEGDSPLDSLKNYYNEQTK